MNFYFVFFISLAHILLWRKSKKALCSDDFEISFNFLINFIFKRPEKNASFVLLSTTPILIKSSKALYNSSPSNSKIFSSSGSF